MEEFKFNGKRGFYKATVRWGQEQLKNGTISDSDVEDYNVLNNIGCGSLCDDNWEIKKDGNNKKHHFLINGKYEDPDSKSENLYLLAAYKYSERAKKMNIQCAFTIGQRSNKSSYFCLLAKNMKNNVTTELGGDWIIDWDDVNHIFDGLGKEERYKILEKVHTVKWHTFWPCNQIDGHITVNQARGWRSMYETLNDLKFCYENNFEDKVWENQNPYALKRAFCENNEWYQLFESYDNYIKFWDLEFVQDDVSKMIKL